MPRRILTFADSVRAVGIGKHGKWLVALLITLLGGAIGLGLARLAFMGKNPMAAFFPGFGVTNGTIGLGLLLALALGLVSGAIPALQSARLSVVGALRRVA